MDQRGGLQKRGRSSFEKAAHGEPPPRLQVIGFNVPAPTPDHAKLESLQITSKPASSPRSALQQLLLNQSVLPSTSSPSSNHSLPYAASSSPSTNHNLTTSGLLLQQPAISPPATNHNCTSGVSKPLCQPPSAYQSNSSSGLLKSLLQSHNASSDVPANQSSLFSSLGQSQCASSSSSSWNQRMRGGSVSVNVQIINQHISNPSTAPIKENYEAFFQIKQTDDEACYEEKKKNNNGNDAKILAIKAPLITSNAKEVINELSYVAKSKKSSWLHDDEHPSAEKCKKSSWKGVQLINECRRNEEKSKKSSLFMFVVSSPAPEFHHHHHHGEYNMAKHMDFLSSCHLCRRFLGQGEDVFMYSGDKAFCSMECRYQQIVIDERKERCPPPIIRSGASQVYQHTSITTTTTHHPIMINKPHFINTAAAA